MTLRHLLLSSMVCCLAACSTVAAPTKPFASARISVEMRGEGPDVVLIPGLATSRDVWSSTVTAVPGFRYHLVQVKGFAGMPAEGNAEAGPVLAPLAAEIARYITSERLDRPAVIGHSLGGHLAMMVTAAVPSHVSRLMIVDTVPYGAMLFGGVSVTPEQARAFGADARKRYFGADSAAAMRKLYPSMIGNADALPTYTAQAIASDPDVSGRLFEEVAVADLRPRLAGLTLPVTVMYVGDADMASLYRAAFSDLPQARLVQVPDSRHYIMLDQPKRFHDEVRDFLHR